MFPSGDDVIFCVEEKYSQEEDVYTLLPNGFLLSLATGAYVFFKVQRTNNIQVQYLNK